MTWSRPSRENIRACPLVGSGPCVHRHRRRKPEGVELEYTASSGRKTGSILAPSSQMARRPGRPTTASNLDTLLGRGNDREVRMLLSFQRPSHLFKKGFPSQGRIQEPSGSRSGPVSIAPKSRAVEGPRFRPAATDPGRLPRVAQTGATPVRTGLSAYDSTCTVTTRLRGRSSKSIRTICCQVPSASSPPTTGIVSEGPMIAARRWAWELVSWLRRLCS